MASVIRLLICASETTCFSFFSLMSSAASFVDLWHCILFLLHFVRFHFLLSSFRQSDLCPQSLLVKHFSTFQQPGLFLTKKYQTCESASKICLTELCFFYFFLCTSKCYKHFCVCMWRFCGVFFYEWDEKDGMWAAKCQLERSAELPGPQCELVLEKLCRSLSVCGSPVCARCQAGHKAKRRGGRDGSFNS